MTKFKDKTLLVTGASGHLGRIAVEELLARGATNIIAATRDPSKIADLAARGVTVRKLDFDDAATLAPAFAGVDRVLLVSTDSVGRRGVQHKAAVDAIKAAGVAHIVYTSAPAARPDPDAGLAPEHFWTEVAIAASGLDFTILRNHMYAENNLMSAAQTIASGQLYGLQGDRGTAYVARADTARTAAGALLSAEGKSIADVTGPAVVTNTDLAAVLARLSGKPVASVPLSVDQLRGGMQAAGLPAPLVDILVAFQRDATQGYHAIVTDTVRRYSGREPQALEAVLAPLLASSK
ncbi:NAD(P)H dehydrogenase (quinone) [Devosia enhydra]|uniref:NAD(P)H dehydrogenase (Quinone) n=1 Tax=Devosia enhydra TaxID=665118 RepID=A0A1K2HV51_9HYPH|nr:SDR family oxidoreductase [Devosia enhydra]SFZ82329.1 NAD(P)H dehydrogenase (quinone) [Devosia enhydra]